MRSEGQLLSISSLNESFGVVRQVGRGGRNPPAAELTTFTFSRERELNHGSRAWRGLCGGSPCEDEIAAVFIKINPTRTSRALAGRFYQLLSRQ